VLSDGLPLYGAQGDSFTLLQVPPLDLGQVEVIKGAASALYGTAALGGFINLVSRRPAVRERLAPTADHVYAADLLLFAREPTMHLSRAPRQSLSDRRATSRRHSSRSPARPRETFPFRLGYAAEKSDMLRTVVDNGRIYTNITRTLRPGVRGCAYSAEYSWLKFAP
jgi:hypothetical protein